MVIIIIIWFPSRRTIVKFGKFRRQNGCSRAVLVKVRGFLGTGNRDRFLTYYCIESPVESYRFIEYRLKDFPGFCLFSSCDGTVEYGGCFCPRCVAFSTGDRVCYCKL